MKRIATLAVCALLVLGACGGDDSSSEEQPTETTDAPTDWDDDALATAERLADEIREAGIDCDEYSAWEYGIIAADYEGKLPMPIALTSCTGPGGEDITFEVFADLEGAYDFYAAKLFLVCEGARKQNLIIPGLPYVDGVTWLIEPDEEGTADRIADVVDGESKLGTCPELPATTTTAEA